MRRKRRSGRKINNTKKNHNFHKKFPSNEDHNYEGTTDLQENDFNMDHGFEQISPDEEKDHGYNLGHTTIGRTTIISRNKGGESSMISKELSGLIDPIGSEEGDEEEDMGVTGFGPEEGNWLEMPNIIRATHKKRRDKE